MENKEVEERIENYKRRYLNEPRIDIMKYVNKETKEIFNRLGIVIENKLYTEYEYDLIDEKVLEYYVDETDPTYVPPKLLSEKNVSKEEYDNVLEVFSKIVEEYNL